MEYPVMIVDDDPSVCSAVVRFMEYAKIPVVAVESGKACLEELKKGFKGLILMDVIMPEMDGWDTIKEMVNRGFPEGVIVCMLTGKEVPDAKMDELKEYVMDYIRKPFDYAKLVKIVREYLSYLD